MEYLYDYNKDGFDVDKNKILDDCFESFLLPQPKEDLLEATLAGKCISHRGYGKEGV